jgi:CRISPR/Cas system endoribonuclease Cas6 (RAMP superfamily)
MIKFKFELVPQEGVIDPYVKPYGYIFRAVLMDWLHEIAPKLVHELHDYNKIRPYAIQVEYRKESLIFYLHVFDSTLSTPLINDLINKKNKSFIISGEEYQVRKVLFEEISLGSIVDNARPIKTFRIIFREPTYFSTSRGNIVIRLPVPELMFSNLANLWDTLAGVGLGIDQPPFLEWINSTIFPSSLDIKTEAKEMGEKVPAAGIIGWVNFEVAAYHPFYAKIVDILCRFGTLSNLGKNRTAGLGIISYEPLGFFKKQKDTK